MKNEQHRDNFERRYAERWKRSLETLVSNRNGATYKTDAVAQAWDGYQFALADVAAPGVYAWMPIETAPKDGTRIWVLREAKMAPEQLAAQQSAQPVAECPSLHICKGHCFQCEYYNPETGALDYPAAQPVEVQRVPLTKEEQDELIALAAWHGAQCCNLPVSSPLPKAQHKRTAEILRQFAHGIKPTGTEGHQ